MKKKSIFSILIVTFGLVMIMLFSSCSDTANKDISVESLRKQEMNISFWAEDSASFADLKKATLERIAINQQFHFEMASDSLCWLESKDSLLWENPPMDLLKKNEANSLVIIGTYSINGKSLKFVGDLFSY